MYELSAKNDRLRCYKEDTYTERHRQHKDHVRHCGDLLGQHLQIRF